MKKGEARILHAVLHGRPVGRVEMDRDGRLSFVYEEAWRRFDGAFPLSLSLPLAAARHGHVVIDAFLSGLLPDSDAVLNAWARRFQTSRHPFALLAHVGEDCPGAFQFVGEDRLAELETRRSPRVQWLTEGEVAARLRALRSDAAAWRTMGDHGQFSLAGAQAKTALLLRDGRWGVPSGRMPTTHILKPPIPGFDGHVENEHLCMELARALGIPTAYTSVTTFEDQTALVVERYDRAQTAALARAAAHEAATWAGSTAAAAAPILRLHQEDMCQALGEVPQHKYQAEGGPGPIEIASLLRAHSGRPQEDVWTFTDALAFNWLVGGTDAHAKNYSILHGGGGRVRLAPLYDVASILVYERFEREPAIKLSMKIGGTYRLRAIDGRSWRKAAKELALDPDTLIDRLDKMARALPEHLESIVAEARAMRMHHPILERLVTVLTDRARGALRLLARR